MKHFMKLQTDPFNLIKSGKKTIEIRLFDEKRQLLKIGDIIEFAKMPENEEKLEVKIIDLLRFPSFRDLLTAYGMEYYGYPADYSIDEFVESMYQYYSKDEEQKYGVLGIKIKLIVTI